MVGMITQKMSFISITIVNHFGDTHALIFRDREQITTHTDERRVLLRSISETIVTMSTAFDKKIPIITCLSADGYLLVFSITASCVGYGMSVILII
jgi:hypothetical protein